MLLNYQVTLAIYLIFILNTHFNLLQASINFTVQHTLLIYKIIHLNFTK